MSLDPATVIFKTLLKPNLYTVKYIIKKQPIKTFLRSLNFFNILAYIAKNRR